MAGWQQYKITFSVFTGMKYQASCHEIFAFNISTTGSTTGSTFFR